MNWIIKAGKHLTIDGNMQVAVLTLQQKRKFAGKPKENVLILEKVNNNWTFTLQYRINEIIVQGHEPKKDANEEFGPETETGENAANPITTISLTLVSLIEDKGLNDYIFSLRRITNYRNPVKHFNQKYNRISNAEFEAIIDDKIYWKRTVVGTVFHALHQDHQRSFVAHAVRQSPSILVGKVNLDVVLRQLVFYLDNAIIKPALYLQRSAQILKEHLSDEAYAAVGFSEGLEPSTSIGVNRISEQAEVIRESLGVIPSIESLLSIEESSDSRRFDKLFKNAGIPLTLEAE